MIKRIYHHHDKWEEVPAGMWAATPTCYRKMLVENAIDFTGDHELYGRYMLRVIKLWPYSCEHNLTAIGQTGGPGWVMLHVALLLELRKMSPGRRGIISPKNSKTLRMIKQR